MGQIQVYTYKKNSYIVVEGENSKGSFFIIQSGTVRLTKSLAISEIEQQDIGQGDFFEVESALTGHRCIMNAIAISDCSIIVVPKDMFNTLISKRPSLVQKMILSFSQKMRKLDHLLTKNTAQEDVLFSFSSWIEMGKYYEKQGMIQPALLCFHNCIKYNQHSISLDEAKAHLQKIKERYDDDNNVLLEENITKTLVQYKKDQMIFCEGMPGECMYFIQEGSVRIAKYVNNSEITLAVLQSGNLFGEMALLESKPRSANVIANSDCALLLITNKNFPLIVKKKPSIIIQITTVLAERIWFVYRQITNSVLPAGKERLFDALLMFAESQKIDENKNRDVELKITVKDLIKHTGMQYDVANKVIKEFVDENIITIKEDSIVISSLQYVTNRANYFQMTYANAIKHKSSE